MEKATTRILAAHASPQLTNVLSQAAKERQDVSVISTCREWDEARALARTLRPDVLTLDVALPGFPGPSAIAELVAEERLRVVVTSTAGCGFEEDTVACLGAGAVDFVCRRPEHTWTTSAFLNTLFARIRQAARVPVERLSPPQVPDLAQVLSRYPNDVIMLAGGVGAPEMLLRMLPRVRGKFSGVLCILLDIPGPITRSLSHYLAARCDMPVCEARPGLSPRPGSVVVLPGSYSTALRHTRDGNLTFFLCPRAPGLGNSRHLDDTLEAFAGMTRTHLVLLSGAGPDGIRAAAAARNSGGEVFLSGEECTLFPDLCDAVYAQCLPNSSLPTRLPSTPAPPMVISMPLAA